MRRFVRTAMSLPDLVSHVSAMDMLRVVDLFALRCVCDAVRLLVVMTNLFAGRSSSSEGRIEDFRWTWIVWDRTDQAGGRVWACRALGKRFCSLCFRLMFLGTIVSRCHAPNVFGTVDMEKVS